MFKVGPDHLDILESAFVRIVLDTTQKIALHIYRIHMSRICKRFGDEEYIRAAPRSEIGDGHSGINPERPDIAPRVRESCRSMRCIRLHVGSITSFSSLTRLNQQNITTS